MTIILRTFNLIIILVKNVLLFKSKTPQFTKNYLTLILRKTLFLQPFKESLYFGTVTFFDMNHRQFLFLFYFFFVILLLLLYK